MKPTSLAFIVLSSCITLAACGDSTPVSAPKADAVQARAGAEPAVPAHEEVPAPHLVMAPFSAALVGVATSDDCALDAVNSAQRAAYEVKRGNAVEVAGWAGDRKLDRAPAQVEFVLEGDRAFSVTVPLNQPRPDVANVLGKPAFDRVGYRVVLDTSQMVPGSYRIAIKYEGQAGPIVCRPQASITVT